MAFAENLYLPLGPLTMSLPSWSSLALADTVVKVAGIFQVPPGAASRVLTRVGCRIANVTGTSPFYRMSIQGVDGNGRPDGTIKGGGSPASVNYQFGPWPYFQVVNLANSYTAAPGEWVAVVIDYGSGSINSSNRAQIGYVMSGIDAPLAPYGMDYQGAWTKRNEVGPFVLGTATELWGMPVESAAASPNFSSSSNPNEYGMKFTVPSFFSSVKAYGLHVSLGTVASGTWTVSLYDGGGPSDTTVLEAVTIDTDVGVGNANRKFPLLFDVAALPTLTGGNTYRITVRPDGAYNLSLYYNQVTEASHWDAGPLRQTSCYTTRAGGSWTDNALRKFPWALILDDIAIASGGGGVPIGRIVSGGV